VTRSMGVLRSRRVVVTGRGRQSRARPRDRPAPSRQHLLRHPPHHSFCWASRSHSPEIAPFSTEFSGAFASTARPNSALSERTPLVAPSSSTSPGGGGDGLSPEERKAAEEAAQRAKWLAVGAATASGVAVLVGAVWLMAARRDHHH
jgi:hypothetical protein